MNRLVIIGNGFDLAHGLPTSYRDFIDDYWSNVNDSSHNKLVSFNLENFIEFKKHKNLDELINEILRINNTYKREGIEVYKLKERLVPLADNRVQIIKYENIFFKLMNKELIENWVDIENLYYRILKERAKGKLNDKSYIWDIKQLNKNFEEIKNLFETYLIKVVEQNYNWEKIKNVEIIKHLIGEPSYNDFLFNNNQEEYYNNLDNFSIDSTILLSFNYTKTVFDYSEDILKSKFNIYYNYIHGKIGSKDLPIIFGFGDEMDKEYQLIEDIDDNEYLKNFKSIQYLERSNYKNLHNFIESGPFQVFLMGHSCGLSDRTLLSTIFESKHCLSVKVFYHEYLDEFTGKVRDNYTEIVQNISRHFTDKKMLRKKVVEKRHCKPLIKYQETN